MNKIFIINEMSVIATPKDQLPIYSMIVNSNDHKPPHCHVKFNVNNRDYKIVINNELPNTRNSILTVDEYNSKNKNKLPKSTLTNSQRDKLLTVFHTERLVNTNKGYQRWSLWKIAATTWNRANREIIIPNLSEDLITEDIIMNDLIESKLDICYISDIDEELKYLVTLVVSSEDTGSPHFNVFRSNTGQLLAIIAIPNKHPKSINDINIIHDYALTKSDIKAIYSILTSPGEFNEPKWVIANILWDGYHRTI